MIGCSYDCDLEVWVHRFAPGARLCICGRVSVPEPDRRGFWKRKRVKKRSPVPRLDGSPGFDSDDKDPQ